MDSQTLKTIALYLSWAVPLTTAIVQLSKLALAWIKQNHEIHSASRQQIHQITTHYLDRALDPEVPLAIRYQLLRFLATPDNQGSRLSDWAQAELNRISLIVEGADAAVAEAEKALLGATTAMQVEAAEKRLFLASQSRQSLLGPPKPLTVSPGALRAGLVEEKNLNGIVMKSENLSGSNMSYKKLVGADFSGCNLSDARFQGSDLRGVNLSDCDLTNTVFYQADLRFVDMSNSKLLRCSFEKARLEGAILTGAIIEECDLRLAYDSETIWPDGFDVAETDAVKA